MKMYHLWAIYASFFLIISTSVNATIIASSSFDGSPDDWITLSTDLTWKSSGGNLNTGYIQFNNNLGSNAIIHAPSKYLGDWSNLGVNEITYQANIFEVGRFRTQQPYRVQIEGPGGVATWDGPAAEPSTLWKSLNVPVIESEWNISSGTWAATLEDVTDFRIIMAYYTNSGPFEITGLDNVSLNAVPIPASIFLFGTGLLGLIKISFRRKLKTGS